MRESSPILGRATAPVGNHDADTITPNGRATMGRRTLRYSHQLACAAALAPVLASVYAASFWLRFEGRLSPPDAATLSSTIGLVLILKLAVFAWLRIFHGWNRFVTFHDSIVLIQATSVASLLIALADYLLVSWTNIPRSVFLLDWLGTIAAVGSLRSARRFVAEHLLERFSWGDRRRVFIVGVCAAAEELLRTIRKSKELPFQVVGFIDDQPKNVASRIGGVPVLGALDDVLTLARRHDVDLLLVTGNAYPGRRLRELIDAGDEQQIEVKMLPSYRQLIDGRVTFKPRDVSISDLLQREPAALPTDAIHEWVDGRSVMVTGSAGSIGSEICRQLLQFNPRKLVLIDRSETGQFFLERELCSLNPTVEMELLLADVADGMRMSRVFAAHRPEIVFHAAAYKHVPLVEGNPGEGVKNIVRATRQLADLAERFGVSSFVMISTDKAVNPTSVMGCCKRVAELDIQSRTPSQQTRFVVVRFGNVLDSAGSVIPVFRQQIAAGGPITITHPDMQRYFMTIPEAAQLVIQAGMMGRGGEVFVLDMGEPARIVDLAKDMVRLSGLRLGDDIDLEFIGLRPGEKLYEELVVAGEEQLATSHPKIMVINPGACERRSLDKEIETLCQTVDGPPHLVIEQLRLIVPTYQPADLSLRAHTRRAA